MTVRENTSLAPDPFFIFLFFLFLLFLRGHSTCIACRIFVYLSPLARKKSFCSAIHMYLEVGLKRIMIKNNVEKERNRYKTKTTGASLEKHP